MKFITTFLNRKRAEIASDSERFKQLVAKAIDQGDLNEVEGVELIEIGARIGKSHEQIEAYIERGIAFGEGVRTFRESISKQTAAYRKGFEKYKKQHAEATAAVEAAARLMKAAEEAGLVSDRERRSISEMQTSMKALIKDHRDLMPEVSEDDRNMCDYHYFDGKERLTKGVPDRSMGDGLRVDDPNDDAEPFAPAAYEPLTIPADLPAEARSQLMDASNSNGITVRTGPASQIAAISDTSLPTEKRAEALKFVVHLVADMHQPLHCGDRGDRGGNSFAVHLLEASGKPSNLHSVWDTGILKNIKAGERVAPYAEKLNATITEEQATAWRSGSLITWANEGHRVARDHVYKGLPMPAKVEGEMIGDDAQAVTVLDQAYVDEAKPVIEQQLQRGGIRLASVLNKAFAK